MYLIPVLGSVAFVLCLCLTPICRRLALRLNLVDEPDTDRKFHKRAVPRIGGVPIVLSYVLSLGLVLHFAPAHEKLYIHHHEMLWLLLPAAGLVFLTGLLDDLIGLRPWQKLLGQLAGAGLAVSLGVRISLTDSRFFIHHPALSTPWVSIPLSIAWLIGCTNAVNLIDGLDGLASGVGLVAAVTTLLAALFTGNNGLLLASMPLVGCLLAFLCFNFNPASIFLGDSGSLSIGFMLGCYALIWSQEGGTMLGMAAPLMAFALPLIDVCLAISRRYLRRVPIFKGDRGHIHHMVLARGFNPRSTALILYAICAVAAALALVQGFSRQHLHGVVIGMFIVLVWAGVKYLNYVELGAAGRALSRKRVLSFVREEIYLHEMERSIAAADTPEACWTVVSKICADMRFATVEMFYEEKYFSMVFEDDAKNCSWKITLPLGGRGFLTLSRTSEEAAPKLMMASIERLQRELTAKQKVTVPVYAELKGAA